MNIYKNLNEITKYIDENLENEINYDHLAKFLGVNTYTLHRLFTMIAGISLSEYIRKRRLSNAGFDLFNEKSKIIDIAIKYQYENATSFARAFEKFHGIKPSLVNKETKLKNFPRIIFNEEITLTSELDYEIIELPAFSLYGVGVETNNDTIEQDAPRFFEESIEKYSEKYGKIDYGMISYDESDIVHENCNGYYILYKKEIPEFKKFDFPASKWLKFRINSDDATDIREMSQKFYLEFLPSCKYNLREIPELEYYHEVEGQDITDFLVAIY